MRTEADEPRTKGESREVLPQGYRAHREPGLRGKPTFNVTVVKRPPRKPVVYFVQAENGLIKIGSTNYIEDRMKSLSSQSPLGLTLLATVRGDRAKEFAYHLRFAAHRLHGEWFQRCPEIEAEIERLNSNDALRGGGNRKTFGRGFARAVAA